MDSGTIIISGILVLVCVVCGVLLNNHSRKRKKARLQAFLDRAGANEFHITQYELWDDTAIGIDEAARVVFYAGKAHDKEIVQQMGLDEIQSCRVIPFYRTVKDKTGDYTVVEKMELGISWHDKNRPELLLEFFNASNSRMGYTGNLKSAEKWCGIIKQYISGGKE